MPRFTIDLDMGNRDDLQAAVHTLARVMNTEPLSTDGTPNLILLNPDDDDDCAKFTVRIGTYSESKPAVDAAPVLPPDPECMNDDRAKWADRAVEAFIMETLTDPEDALADLLGDLRHWADRHPEYCVSFDTADERGRQYYEEETTDNGGAIWP
jgi:hypothetical protein